LQYRVRATNIVNPEDVWVLDPTDHPTLTLVTCYPFEFLGHAPQRFIVSGDLVKDVERTADEQGRSDLPSRR
jgi:sortase A